MGRHPGIGRAAGRRIYVALGRGEVRAGRSLEALLAAYRIGARVAWRRAPRPAWPRASRRRRSSCWPRRSSPTSTSCRRSPPRASRASRPSAPGRPTAAAPPCSTCCCTSRPPRPRPWPPRPPPRAGRRPRAWPSSSGPRARRRPAPAAPRDARRPSRRARLRRRPDPGARVAATRWRPRWRAPPPAWARRGPGRPPAATAGPSPPWPWPRRRRRRPGRRRRAPRDLLARLDPALGDEIREERLAALQDETPASRERLEATLLAWLRHAGTSARRPPSSTSTRRPSLPPGAPAPPPGRRDGRSRCPLRARICPAHGAKGPIGKPIFRPTTIDSPAILMNLGHERIGRGLHPRGSEMESLTSGTLAGTGSFRCEECGYVVTLAAQDQLPDCPGCGGSRFARASLFATGRFAQGRRADARGARAAHRRRRASSSATAASTSPGATATPCASSASSASGRGSGAASPPTCASTTRPSRAATRSSSASPTACACSTTAASTACSSTASGWSGARCRTATRSSSAATACSSCEAAPQLATPTRSLGRGGRLSSRGGDGGRAARRGLGWRGGPEDRGPLPEGRHRQDDRGAPPHRRLPARGPDGSSPSTSTRRATCRTTSTSSPTSSRRWATS